MVIGIISPLFCPVGIELSFDGGAASIVTGLVWRRIHIVIWFRRRQRSRFVWLTSAFVQSRHPAATLFLVLCSKQDGVTFFRGTEEMTAAFDFYESIRIGSYFKNHIRPFWREIR